MRTDGISWMGMVAIGLLAVSCSASPNGSATSTTADETSTTTAAVATSTTAATTTSSVPPAGPPFELTESLGVAYQEPTDGWKSPELDVYAPVGEGPWPVVITYHPDMAVNSRSSMTDIAKELAELGAVVFNPNYGFGGRSAEALRFYLETNQLSCIYWYVHEQAATYGGDPDDITLFGFSGGAHAAAATAMARDMDPSGCFAEPTPIEPTSAILFEGDWTLAPFWDGVLQTDPDVFAESMVLSSFDTSTGPPLHFVIDVRTTTNARFQVQPDAYDEYFRLRAGGDLRGDLEEIGAFDDGRLDLTEASRLFHHRVLEAGGDATLTVTDAAAHVVSADVLEVVAEFVFGSATGD